MDKLPSLEEIGTLMHATPWLPTAVGLMVLLLAAWITNSLFKQIILRLVSKALSFTFFGRDEELQQQGLIKRLTNIMPALVIIVGIQLIPGLPETAVNVITNVANGFIILTISLAMGAALNMANILYMRRPDANIRPIKGYIQMAKLLVYLVASVLIIATLIDRSPVVLLSGLGAMAAVLMLVFQDTLLSVVASLQISSADMLRKGDWIEMPSTGANGDVIDVALHTVKVQNWDKTITTIPTRKLVNESFKNWRGMEESGGRRINRALYLDQNSLGFLDEKQLKDLHKFRLIQEYLTEKTQEVSDWNKQLPKEQQHLHNERRLTNIGTFRIYVLEYLKSRPDINHNMTLMVRQLAPTPNGLPLEVYAFTSTTEWAKYESIQSDIFDHLYAIAPLFGLRVFQQPSGADFQSLGVSRKQTNHKQ